MITVEVGNYCNHSLLSVPLRTNFSFGFTCYFRSSTFPEVETFFLIPVQEFLALSRGDAIQLLVQYDGSVDNVFAHLMS